MKVENFLGALSPECQTGSRRSLYFESWREGGGEGEGAVSGYKQRTVHTTHHSVCLHIHFLHPCFSTFKKQTKCAEIFSRPRLYFVRGDGGEEGGCPSVRSDQPAGYKQRTVQFAPPLSLPSTPLLHSREPDKFAQTVLVLYIPPT